MPNPAVVVCPKDAWTPVAIGITTAIIHVLDTKPHQYLQTYRLTTNPAPADNVDAVPFETELTVSSGVAIDIYIQPVGEDGSVRVDT